MDKSKNLKRDLQNISKKTGLGTISIYYYKDKIKRFPTKIKLNPCVWDTELSMPKKNALPAADQLIVDSLYNKILKLITDYQFKFNQLPPVSYIENNLDKPVADLDIHKLYQDFVNSKRTAKRTEGTVNYYKYFGERLKKIDLFYSQNLSLHNFDYSFIEKIVEYSFKEDISNGTINQRFEILKGFVKYLDKKEIKHNIKLDNYDRLDEDKVSIVCLEKNELEEIINYTPKTLREQRVKDIIVFLSHTGIRKSDLLRISKDNVVGNCLEFMPLKTIRKRIVCKVPISKPVQDILERYDYKPPYYSGKYLNPYIVDFCSNIKSLQHKIRHKGLMVEKYKILTSHSVGRKTFSNLAIQAGVPIPTLMGMTGHTTIDTVLKSYLDKHQNNQNHLAKVFEF